MLPIYGPSGSGKSSLARAGLIPEFARRPLPGYAQARVAALVPGTHPLEALVSVLARVATNDLTPVAKTREFAEELEKVNKQGASAFKALAGPGWHRCLANQVASPLVCDWAIAQRQGRSLSVTKLNVPSLCTAR